MKDGDNDMVHLQHQEAMFLEQPIPLQYNVSSHQRQNAPGLAYSGDHGKFIKLLFMLDLMK